MDRRRYLALGATAALAGCLGTGGAGETNGGSTTPTDSAGGEPGDAGGTDGGEALQDHPALQAVEAQPALGPDPREATGVIVAFEDPSCPTCARFEQNVLPQLREELVDPGTVSLVFRGYPVIHPWGQPGTRALEAVYDADPAAHWTLAAHYFANQSRYHGSDEATVYDETATFLDEETDLDGSAIVDRASAGEYDDAVQTDLDAGQNAGASGTPTFFLFRDGEHVKTLTGVIGVTTFENLLVV